MKRGLKRFFVVCGIVAGVGALCSVVGLATDGISSMDKVTGKYSWFHSGTSENNSTVWEDDSRIDSVKIEGMYDVRIKKGESDSVKVFYADMKMPSISNNNGNLTVIAGEEDEDFSISFTAGSDSPYVEITCADGKKLTGLDIDTDNGDVSISGVDAAMVSIDAECGNIKLENVTFNKGDISGDNGDMEFINVTSNGLQVENECGECNLSGTFRGVSEIEVDNGNLIVNTSLDESMYKVSAYTESAGSMSIGKTELDYSDGKFVAGTGPNKLILHVECGNIEVNYNR